MTDVQENEAIPERDESTKEITPTRRQVSSIKGSSFSNNIDNLLAQAINLSDDNILHEPTCDLCSLPCRKELEEIWESSASITSVKALAEDTFDITL